MEKFHYLFLYYLLIGGNESTSTEMKISSNTVRPDVGSAKSVDARANETTLITIVETTSIITNVKAATIEKVEAKAPIDEFVPKNINATNEDDIDAIRTSSPDLKGDSYPWLMQPFRIVIPLYDPEDYNDESLENCLPISTDVPQTAPRVSPEFPLSGRGTTLRLPEKYNATRDHDQSIPSKPPWFCSHEKKVIPEVSDAVDDSEYQTPPEVDANPKPESAQRLQPLTVSARRRATASLNPELERNLPTEDNRYSTDLVRLFHKIAEHDSRMRKKEALFDYQTSEARKFNALLLDRMELRSGNVATDEQLISTLRNNPSTKRRTDVYGDREIQKSDDIGTPIPARLMEPMKPDFEIIQRSTNHRPPRNDEPAWMSSLCNVLFGLCILKLGIIAWYNGAFSRRRVIPPRKNGFFPDDQPVRNALVKV